MADVTVRNEGSIIMLTPVSAEGKAWIDENLGLESWQWLGNSCAIEWRYAPDIVHGMMDDGLEVIPDHAHITDEDKQWLSQLGITASKKKKATEPQVNLRPQTAPRTPTVPGAVAPSVPNANVGAEKALALEQQMSEQKEEPNQEKHTVPPELPNKLFHMADGEDTVEVENDEDDLKSEYRNLGSTAEFLQKAWNESTKNAVSRGYMAGALDALRWANKITPQEYSEGYGPYVEGNGTAKQAGRGGWHYVSRYTVESDDKRFTITLIDPTRESKWFLLKDTQTGKSYDRPTKTDAKKLAIRIRESKADEFHHDDGSDRYSLAGEPVQAGTPVEPPTHEASLSSSFTNGLLKGRKEI